mmetsp:Transcript_80197/g.206418  ORF Transcript_80197/g.206418 Transcript_80197/m.206418 type:complete len:369 (+) Transcript_80197:2283-3389(+)
MRAGPLFPARVHDGAPMHHGARRRADLGIQAGGRLNLVAVSGGVAGNVHVARTLGQLEAGKARGGCLFACLASLAELLEAASELGSHLLDALPGLFGLRHLLLLGLAPRRGHILIYRHLEGEVTGTVLHPMIGSKPQHEHEVVHDLVRGQGDAHLLHARACTLRKVDGVSRTPLLARIRHAVVQHDRVFGVRQCLHGSVSPARNGQDGQVEAVGLPLGGHLGARRERLLSLLHNAAEVHARPRHVHLEVGVAVLDPLVRRHVDHEVHSLRRVSVLEDKEDAPRSIGVSHRELALHRPRHSLSGRDAGGQDVRRRVLPATAEGLDRSPVADRSLRAEALHDHLDSLGGTHSRTVNQHLDRAVAAQVHRQ